MTWLRKRSKSYEKKVTKLRKHDRKNKRYKKTFFIIMIKTKDNFSIPGIDTNQQKYLTFR